MRTLITIVAASLLIAACGGQDDDAADTTLGGGADTVAEAPTTTAAATTTSVEPETTTTMAATATTTTTSATAVEFPPGLDTFTQGGEVWAVVLAGGAGGDEPEMAAAQTAAEQAGYSTGPTDCDEGAAAALGLPSDQSWVTVSVYLQNEADALLAQQAFAAQNVEGTVALIRTYCLD